MLSFKEGKALLNKEADTYLLYADCLEKLVPALTVLSGKCVMAPAVNKVLEAAQLRDCYIGIERIGEDIVISFSAKDDVFHLTELPGCTHLINRREAIKCKGGAPGRRYLHSACLPVFEAQIMAWRAEADMLRDYDLQAAVDAYGEVLKAIENFEKAFPRYIRDFLNLKVDPSRVAGIITRR